MTQELQREKSEDENPELEELLDMERKAGEHMREAKYSDDRSSEGLLGKARRKLRRNTERVNGEVESVKKVSEKKIKIKVSYDGGSFTQLFYISDSEDLNGNPLYKLLDYKNIRDGQFLDLRGKSVPIDLRGPRQRIVIPERKGRLSDAVFKMLQKSRKYKLVRSRLSKNVYKMTFLGYLVFSGFMAPILFATGDLFSAVSSGVAQVPLLSVTSSVFLALSATFTLIATFVSAIFVLLATGFGIMILMFLIFSIYNFIESKAWPF